MGARVAEPWEESPQDLQDRLVFTEAGDLEVEQSYQHILRIWVPKVTCLSKEPMG